jgi:NAD(P)-dependent dehydrogenase (short-subunit alcohol dehydrogenase family)
VRRDSGYAHGDGSDAPVVVVTGASSGIGRATSALLSRQGMRVVLASRSRVALKAAQRECGGAPTLVVPTDVSSTAEVEALFEEALATFGRVDAVVHTAAVLAYGRFEDVPDEIFEHAIEVTLSGTARVARAALRHFATQGGGRLVVVGSLLGKIATPYMSSYVTAKWGVHGLVRCLQIEARETPGVHVSLVSPGGVNTPVYLQAGTYVGLHGRPPPPVVSPERVARVIARRLRRPARDSNVGPANALTIAGFRMLPFVFDRIVGPLMRAGGLAGRVGATAGNVMEPRAENEAVEGPWPGLLGGIRSGPPPPRTGIVDDIDEVHEGATWSRR